LRIPPTPAADWPDELKTFITGFQASVRARRSTEGGPKGPNGANLLGTLAAHPALTQAFLTFNGHLLYGSTLSARQRELLILRVASVRRCRYEWAQHVFQGQVAGLRPEEIDRVTREPESTDWKPVDRSLLAAADQFLADGVVSDQTWGVLAAEFDERQLLDIIFTIGTYEMLAKAMLTLDIEPDEDLIPYLPDES
jgi:alkylhydroperoxidase family enzyme